MGKSLATPFLGAMGEEDLAMLLPTTPGVSLPCGTLFFCRDMGDSLVVKKIDKREDDEWVLNLISSK
jgi:hypothetical protein